MAFWSQKTVEPKRQFRWLLFWTGCPQFVVKSVKKPSYDVATTPHQYLNYEFNYPGRVTWQDVSVTIVDPVAPDSTMSLYRILENSGYVIPTNYAQATAKTISKEGMVNALGGEIKIKQLGADGDPTKALETWVLKNPLITSVDFGDLDYGSDELLNISINLKYDFAYIEELTPLAASAQLPSADGPAGRIWNVNAGDGATRFPATGTPTNYSGDNSG